MRFELVNIGEGEFELVKRDMTRDDRLVSRQAMANISSMIAWKS